MSEKKDAKKLIEEAEDALDRNQFIKWYQYHGVCILTRKGEPGKREIILDSIDLLLPNTEKAKEDYYERQAKKKLEQKIRDEHKDERDLSVGCSIFLKKEDAKIAFENIKNKNNLVKRILKK